MTPWFGLVIMLGFGLLFYRVAEAEGRRAFLWGAMSVLLYAGGLFFLDLSLWPLIGLQAVLFGAMWGLNMLNN